MDTNEKYRHDLMQSLLRRLNTVEAEVSGLYHAQVHEALCCHCGGATCSRCEPCRQCGNHVCADCTGIHWPGDGAGACAVAMASPERMVLPRRRSRRVDLIEPPPGWIQILMRTRLALEAGLAQARDVANDDRGMKEPMPHCEDARRAAAQIEAAMRIVTDELKERSA